MVTHVIVCVTVVESNQSQIQKVKKNLGIVCDSNSVKKEHLQT